METTKPLNELLYLVEELESAHMFLDDLDIPRECGDETYSMVGRIQQLMEK